ncbi:MAG TPA: hypothetical protein VKR06_39675 [Ktedonosporobacter sp.]|nr:hypothetical protein [Ktedonosporobacter sp.]
MIKYVQRSLLWTALSLRERDALVHQTLFNGRRTCPNGALRYGNDGSIVCTICWERSEPRQELVHAIPRYTQNMDAAWLVVEQITQPPHSAEEAMQAANTRFALWWEMATLWAYSREDAAAEICIAALRAAGIELDTTS